MSMVHPMARTTPRTRAEIHDSAASVAELAQAYNISSSTARKWRNRDDLLDRSHKAHQLHTTLSPAQELIVMEIRRLCLLPLDDLVAVTKQFINADASRSGVSRLLRREGLSKLSDLEPRVEGEETSRKTFKDYEPGFVHIDIKFLPKMPDEAQHSYLFVAIDRATRWVFMRIYADQTQGSAVDFLRRVHEAAAFKITKLLTDNGTQFTDRFTSKNKQASGRHSFDRQCKALEIEHRLSPPRRPQTNGMVERFNGRISEVIKQTRFASAAELASTLNNYWQAYNHHIPQRALGHVSPVDSLKNWHQKKPELFRKRIYKQAELDTRGTSACVLAKACTAKPWPSWCARWTVWATRATTALKSSTTTTSSCRCPTSPAAPGTRRCGWPRACCAGPCPCPEPCGCARARRDNPRFRYSGFVSRSLRPRAQG